MTQMAAPHQRHAQALMSNVWLLRLALLGLRQSA